MNILVTGGAGFIGTHTLVALIEAGYTPIVVDDFSNSCPEALQRVETITGKTIVHYELDICNAEKLSAVFLAHAIDAVIHFAAKKAVGESVREPLLYYSNNITGTLTLLKCMHAYGVKRFVFSSSATVYGKPASNPITEAFPLSAENPYGQTKLMIEQMLFDIGKANPDMSIAVLRYFNPIGAHKSGLIGEVPNGIPNNIMPYITNVAVGKLERLSVFGDDYSTPDGTGVRDYIHVVDLAEGHAAAISWVLSHEGVECVNLGTGSGTSVLELISAFERNTGIKIPYAITARRPGDIGECYANPCKASELFGWKSKYNLDDMCKDAWNWQSKNPDGFR